MVPAIGVGRGEECFYLRGEQGFRKLAFEVFLWRKERPFDKLLRQGAAAAGVVALHQIVARGSGNSFKIDAAVVMKICVLGGNKRIENMGANLL